MYMYMGGLASAIRGIDGKAPEMLITDTRDPGQPAMTSVGKFVGREFRSRYVNPAWIKGMQKEGYAGAGAMREFVEYLWGWDATTDEVVDDAMWQETYETYVEDKQNLGMKDYFTKSSPYAFQDITARMIETIRKDYWQADEGVRDRLVTEYLESVTTHGVNCTGVTCGNGRLLRYVMEHASGAGVPAPLVAKARAALEKSMGRTIEAAADQLESFAQRNDAREVASRDVARREGAQTRATTAQADRASPRSNVPTPRSATAQPERRTNDTPPELQGVLMTVEDRTSTVPRVERPDAPMLRLIDVIWPALLFVLILFGWRRQVRSHGTM
jgi:cobaltochelatase CobN